MSASSPPRFFLFFLRLLVVSFVATICAGFICKLLNGTLHCQARPMFPRPSQCPGKPRPETSTSPLAVHKTILKTIQPPREVVQTRCSTVIPAGCATSSGETTKICNSNSTTTPSPAKSFTTRMHIFANFKSGLTSMYINVTSLCKLTSARWQSNFFHIR